MVLQLVYILCVHSIFAYFFCVPSTVLLYVLTPLPVTKDPEEDPNRFYLVDPAEISTTNSTPTQRYTILFWNYVSCKYIYIQCRNFFIEQLILHVYAVT